MDILLGLYQLKHLLPAEANDLFEGYEAQMLDNLHRRRLSHDPEMLRSEQERLLASLNKLSNQYSGRQFQELCFNTKVPSVLSTASPTPAYQPSVPDKATHIPFSPRNGTEQYDEIQIKTKLLTRILPTQHFYYKTESLPSPLSISINNDYQGCTDVNLHIHVHILEYSNPAIQTVTINAREKLEIPLMPLLKPNMVATLDDVKPATLQIQVFRGDELIYAYHEIIELHARNTALLAVKRPDRKPVDLTDCLAAWVTPRNDKIEVLLRQAADYHNEGRFVGYQQGQPSRESIESVRRQAQAIFEVLRHGIKLKYIDSSNNVGTENEQITQRVRLPTEVLLSGGSANCLEGALLFASLLELASIDPVILHLPDHAVVGWHTHPGEEQYEFVDAELIPTEDFTTARHAGQQHYEKALTQKLFDEEIFGFIGFARLIDIHFCRDRGIYSN